MASEQKTTRPQLPLSVKAVIVLLGIVLLATLVMQGVSVVNFELARALGFQEDDPNSPDPFIRGRTLLEQGTAGADLIVQGLLLVGAIVGLLQRRAFGYACALAQLGISIYWPTFDMLQESLLVSRGVMERLDLSIVAFEVVYIVLSLAAAVILYRHRRLFSS